MIHIKGSVPEWLKGADCKSAALRYVGSNPTRPIFSFNHFYKPAILLRIMYRSIINIKKAIIITIRNFLILNKFLKGAKITKIRPAKLLIKKRG